MKTRGVEQRVAESFNEEQTPKASGATRFFVASGIFATVALQNWSMVVFSLQGLMLLAIFLHLAKHRLKVQGGAYLAWYGSFLVWCLLSYAWAQDQARVLAGVPAVAQFIIVGTALVAYVLADRSPEFVLNCIAWSILGLVVVLIAVTPLEIWRESLELTTSASSDQNRLGYTVDYHPNALGRVLAFGGFIWVYKLSSQKTHRLPKLLVLVLLVTVLLMTKSRVAIVVFFALVFFYLLFTSRNFPRFLGRAALGSALLGAFLWAMLNISTLYNAVGFRFAAMFAEDGTSDASTVVRGEMLDVALDLFAKNPIFGVGFWNYGHYYFYEYGGWTETSAHNTYAELLAGLGIIGIVTYYAIPFWTTSRFFSKFRSRDRSDRKLLAFLFLLSASQLVADFSSGSIENDALHLVLALLFAWAILLSRREDNERQGENGAVTDEPSGTTRRSAT